MWLHLGMRKKIPGELETDLVLLHGYGVPRRAKDPLASWEKTEPEPELPPFEPGERDGVFADPVVDPNASDLEQAVPSLRKRRRKKHLYEHERTIIRIES